MAKPLAILALVHRVPYPPNKGEKIRAYNELKYLAERGHTIDLATFADVEADQHWHRELRAICREVVIMPQHKKLGRLWSLRELPSDRPLSVGYYASLPLAHTVKGWIRNRGYDVAFCYSSPMAEYARGSILGGARMVRVMDFVDVDSDKWRQYAEHTEQPMRTIYRLEADRLARYERTIAREFDASIFVSDAEVATFRGIAPDARELLAIPNGVDTQFFGAVERRPAPADAPLLVFVGQMDYFANVDGVKYFAEQAMPLIRAKFPKARFQIVGRAPTPEVLKLGALPGVEVTGEVPDVRTYLAGATLMVAPLRIARGIQNKVLEGMAARVPVIASPQVFAGIAAVDREHLYVAADPQAFAAHVAELCGSAETRQGLVERARRFVEDRYSWGSAMKKLERVMEEKLAASGIQSSRAQAAL